jgi:hypothetical protein
MDEIRSRCGRFWFEKFNTEEKAASRVASRLQSGERMKSLTPLFQPDGFWPSQVAVCADTPPKVIHGRPKAAPKASHREAVNNFAAAAAKTAA